MKRVMSLVTVSFFALGGFAFAANPAAPTSAAPAATAGDGPGDACKKIVEAAKKDDFDAFQKLTHGHQAKTASKGFHKMHKEYMDKLKDLTCGSDLAADDHAVVVAEASGKKRLIPFVKEASGWQFDAATYMTIYFGGKMPGHGHGGHGKKAK